VKKIEHLPGNQIINNYDFLLIPFVNFFQHFIISICRLSGLHVYSRHNTSSISVMANDYPLTIHTTDNIMLQFIILCLLLLTFTTAFSQDKSKRYTAGDVAGMNIQHGALTTEKLSSKILEENRIGLNTIRNNYVSLPPSYARSGKSYPAVFYCHSVFQNPEQVFADDKIVKLLERGICRQSVKTEFMGVVRSLLTSTTVSLFITAKIYSNPSKC
jgi:hypothetical protein